MAQTLLKVDNINVYYGAIHAIKGVSFEVNEGEIVTLIGANGAGKTTAMRIMLGALGASVVLGFAGNKTAHVLTGAVFSALLADHVWKRRKAL